jgi:hypothetical protein
MLNLAKYGAVAALAGGLGIAATEPASAWGYGYNCGDGCGYGYGAFGPYAYGSYPYYGNYGYRPFYRPYRHHFYGYDGPRGFYRHWGW